MQLPRIARESAILAILIVCVVLIASPPSQGVQIAVEDFETYGPASQLHGQNGPGGWTGAWNVTAARQAEVTVVNGGLNYAMGQITLNGGNRAARYVATEATAQVLAGRAIPAQTGAGPIYLGFLYQNSVDNGSAAASADDFIQFGFDTATTSNPRVSAMDRNTTFQVRANTATQADTGITSTAGNTFLLVLRAEKTGASATYNSLSVFVNPDDATETNNTSTALAANSTLDLSGAAALAIRKAFQEVGDTYLVDEIRIADSFREALGLPPAPTPNFVVKTLFEDPFDVDPAANGWTEAVSGGANPGDVNANGAGQALLATDGLNVDGNDFDTRSITRTIDATKAFDVFVELDAFDDADNLLEPDDSLRIQADVGAGFFDVFVKTGDFASPASATSNPLATGVIPIPGAAGTIFQLRIVGVTNVEDYLLDHVRVTANVLIPEPVTSAMLVIGGAALLRRRRRQ